ncbi:hypothetical protein SCLCIDRAFT_443623 [Scleroderma citrinum Foug A]|uniref:Uncharacterized protein n=1 Tax=Scleroderma citrinum Foug A TaxID=1036808 RepID=A0A0C3AL57_9AGAM|nr:hypothetical protein SCLCIDRAFT_443623 [Scleroderma citrinum Foug A]
MEQFQSTHNNGPQSCQARAQRCDTQAIPQRGVDTFRHVFISIQSPDLSGNEKVLISMTGIFIERSGRYI